MRLSPTECRGRRWTSGDKEDQVVQASVRMIPARSTARVMSENPEAVEMSGVWAVAVLRSFFYKVLASCDMVDVRVAAGAALQDLDELQGLATYEEEL